MSKKIEIKIEHVTRVEGHGNIVLDAEDGAVKQVQWQVSEAPRFFEAMMVGRDYTELTHIASRICGICSISHGLVSLKATENAMGVKISDQTLWLRKLAHHAEHLQSHVLHVGYLVAPDLFGVGSVFPLVGTHKDIVVKIVKLHRLANEMSDLFCGRTTHPITLTVGGFTKIPTEKELVALRHRLDDAIETTKEVAGVVLENAGKLPDFTRETEYIALSSGDEYAMYDGVISSTDAGRLNNDDYLDITNEFVVPYSTAKHARHKRDSYMVGALARFNLNSEKLSPLAKDVADMFGLKPLNYNPYMNSVAQLVEVAHCLEDSISKVDALLDTGLKDEVPDFKVNPGRGVGVIEAPRGLLIHDYTIDENGKCINANCVIPTNQNHRNIQKDMEVLAPQLVGQDKDKKEIELTLEMLVRAYDPCISCSTHYLKVDFE